MGMKTAACLHMGRHIMKDKCHVHRIEIIKGYCRIIPGYNLGF